MEAIAFEFKRETRQALFDLTRDPRFWPAMEVLLRDCRAKAVRAALDVYATDTEWRQSQGECKALDRVLDLPALSQEWVTGKTEKPDIGKS